MADGRKMKENESPFLNNQNGLNDNNQTDTDYSSDEGISSEDGETSGRTDRFYERAFAETKRMNSSVYENEEVQAKLREEFGSGIFSNWLREHSQEILSTLPNDYLQREDAPHMTNESVEKNNKQK